MIAQYIKDEKIRELKKKFAKKIRKCRTDVNWTYKRLSEEFSKYKVDVCEHAIRAWERPADKESATFPSLHKLIILGEIFRVSIDWLIGLNEINEKGTKIFTVLPNPKSQKEKTLKKIIELVETKFFDTRINYSDNENKEIILDNEYILKELLFGGIVKINASGIYKDCRNGLLEEKIKKKHPDLNEVVIFNLPDVYIKLENESVRKYRELWGVKYVMFSALLAGYFEKLLQSEDISSIGLANGGTISAMMRLIQRDEKISGKTLFPFLHSEGMWEHIDKTSIGTVSDAIYRFSDLGVKMPHEAYKILGDGKHSDYLNYISKADVLLFSLGDRDTSVLIKMLEDVGAINDKLKQEFCGDLFYNLLINNGVSVEEYEQYGSKVVKSINTQKMLDELINNKLYKKIKRKYLIPIERMQERSETSTLKTIAICKAGITEKVLHAIIDRKKNGKGRLPFNTLITDNYVGKILAK